MFSKSVFLRVISFYFNVFTMFLNRLKCKKHILKKFSESSIIRRTHQGFDLHINLNKKDFWLINFPSFCQKHILKHASETACPTFFTFNSFSDTSTQLLLLFFNNTPTRLRGGLQALLVRVSMKQLLFLSPLPTCLLPVQLFQGVSP